MRGIYLPIEQVLQGFSTEWGRPADHASGSQNLTVQADPALLSGETAAQLLQRIARDRSHPLPEGYHLEWAANTKVRAMPRGAVFGSLPLGYLVMFMITILLFDSFKRATVIWLTVPLAMIGVTRAFCSPAFPSAFGLLGLLSLSGMLVKNGIVLWMKSSCSWPAAGRPCKAVEEASISRVRPVSMAA